MKINEKINNFYNDLQYSECIPEWFMNLELIQDNIDNGWSGYVSIIGTDNKFFYSLDYSYGSCPVCDEWYGFTEEEMKKEFEMRILKYSFEEYEELKKRCDE